MDKVDELVLQAVEQQVFEPKRLIAILTAMSARSGESARQLETEIDRQRIAVSEAQARLDRL